MKSVGLLAVRDDLIRRCLFHPTAAVWEQVSALSQVGDGDARVLGCLLSTATSVFLVSNPSAIWKRQPLTVVVVATVSCWSTWRERRCDSHIFVDTTRTHGERKKTRAQLWPLLRRHLCFLAAGPWCADR